MSLCVSYMLGLYFNDISLNIHKKYVLIFSKWYILYDNSNLISPDACVKSQKCNSECS
jgi:hypothetical protein